jgi:FdhD protein
VPVPDRHTFQLEVRKWRAEFSQPLTDEVAVEEPLEIRVVSGREPEQSVTRIAVTMRTPGEDFELAVGFLYTEGLVRGAADVNSVDYCVDGMADQLFNVVNVHLRPELAFDASNLARNFYTSSSCGVCGKASLEAIRVQGCRPVVDDHLRVSAETLNRLPDELRQAQAVFGRTGGLHAAGLFDADGQLCVLREDVGRHNAVDKVVGERLLADALPASDLLLLVSGRASFEIMQKAAMAGIPLVAAVGAPSSLAIQTAEEFGLTLVGFLRADGFNVYTGGQRLEGRRSS